MEKLHNWNLDWSVEYINKKYHDDKLVLKIENVTWHKHVKCITLTVILKSVYSSLITFIDCFNHTMIQLYQQKFRVLEMAMKKTSFNFFLQLWCECEIGKVKGFSDFVVTFLVSSKKTRGWRYKCDWIGWCDMAEKGKKDD